MEAATPFTAGGTAPASDGVGVMLSRATLKTEDVQAVSDNGVRPMPDSTASTTAVDARIVTDKATAETLYKVTSRAKHDLSAMTSQLTHTMHADDYLAAYTDVAPAMHVSTTFRYTDDPAELHRKSRTNLLPAVLTETPDEHVYSRHSAPNASRLEAVLSDITHGRALTYSSGLSAFHAVLTYFTPRRLVIGKGYHGFHSVVGIIQRLTGLQKIDLFDIKAWDIAGVGPGDIVHIETPENPTGEAHNIEFYAAEAHKRGAYLTVDSTFGPPGLQDPFVHGADLIIHSGTKYIAGHSDMLCGFVTVQRDDWWWGLFKDRAILGAVMGSFEGWLGLRSTRTLQLRVQQQSRSATALAQWLHAAVTDASSPDHAVVSRVVERVHHTAVQALDPAEGAWIKQQMPGGYSPVLAIWMKTPEYAWTLPSHLKLFHHATSLGGVESLIEWRKMSDRDVDERLLRISIGVEGVDDLQADLRSAFISLSPK